MKMLLRVFITIIVALFFVTSPVLAKCGCYDGYGNASAWGGQGALPVLPSYGYYGGGPSYGYYGGPVVIDPFPAISAYGYRNGYAESDDEVYGLRPPLMVRRYYGRRWGWRY
jgi:hypothetical protein